MTKSTLAPVVLFVYARPDHTKRTLNALAENILAKETELFIFCDGPKKESAVEGNRRVIDIITEESKRDRFAKVHLQISEKNKGLANSIIGGVGEIINRYEKCIVVEDDIVTTPYFLSYMNDCLAYYEAEPSVFSISAFTYPLKALNKYPHDVYLSYRACSHGWATWKNRWETVDWSVSDFAELSASRKKRRDFNRGGNDLYRMLRHQVRGERDSWAIRFCYAQSKQNRYTIYPKSSLLKNIGFDGSGTHCQNDTRKQNNTDIDLTKRELKLKMPELNRAVLRDFKRQYRITFVEAVLWLWKKVFKSK